MKKKLLANSDNWIEYEGWLNRIYNETKRAEWKRVEGGWSCGAYWKECDPNDITLFNLYKLGD